MGLLVFLRCLGWEDDGTGAVGGLLCLQVHTHTRMACPAVGVRSPEFLQTLGFARQHAGELLKDVNATVCSCWCWFVAHASACMKAALMSCLWRNPLPAHPNVQRPAHGDCCAHALRQSVAPARAVAQRLLPHTVPHTGTDTCTKVPLDGPSDPSKSLYRSLPGLLLSSAS